MNGEPTHADLVAEYGEPVRTETVPCTTDQWNFPWPRTMPWAKNDTCSICGQTVAMVRVTPDAPHSYGHIAAPHTRSMHWFAVSSDQLSMLHYLGTR